MKLQRLRACAFAFCASALLFSQAALSQNAVTNGDFDADPSVPGNGWTQGGAFGSSWNLADGSPAAPSAQLSAASTAVDDLLTQCVDLSAAPWATVASFAFGGRAKIAQATGTTSIRIDFYGAAGCSGTNTGNSTAGNAAASTNGFTAYASAGVSRPGGTASALVTLRLHTTSSPDNPALGRFDHVFLTASAQNGVVDGDFDADPTVPGSGWTQSGAFGSSWNTSDGSPAFGAAQLGTSSQAVDDRLVQCVDLTAGALLGATTLDFGVRIKNVQFVGTSTMTVDFFPAADCTGTTTGSSTTTTSAAATNGFTEYRHDGAARPASTNGARITLKLHDGSSNPDNASIALFDHVWLGPPGTVPVTLTNFEVR